MLLSKTQLHELIEQGVVIASHSQVNGSSIDLTLHNLIKVESSLGLTNPPVDLYPLDNSPKQSILLTDLDLSQNSYPQLHINCGYILRPDEFVLGSTNEIFNLPLDISAEYKLKSTQARNAFEHLNAGWCLVGETEIPLLNGTSKPIKDLVGTNPWIYSLDEDGEFVPAQASKVWETKRVTETIVVTLDDENNSTFECTPEHKIMLRGGTYLEASKLIVGQALMPLYRKEGQYGHEKVYCPSIVLKSNWANFKGCWRYTHSIVNNVVNGQLPKGYDTHHDDHNKRNNEPSNLKRREKVDHLTHHNRIKNVSEEHRALVSKTASETNKKSWQDPEYRAKMTERAKKSAALMNNKRWGTPIPAEYLNHKVVKVEVKQYTNPIPVYDMTIPEYHNFALEAGIFVHNCDPGWNGSKLTLELKNVSRFHKLILRPNMPIGQMVFFRHDVPVPHEESYAVRGQYNNQSHVTQAKGLRNSAESSNYPKDNHKNPNSNYNYPILNHKNPNSNQTLTQSSNLNSNEVTEAINEAIDEATIKNNLGGNDTYPSKNKSEDKSNG